MDVLKNVFEHHEQEISRRQTYLSNQRKAVEAWIYGGLGELQEAAGRTGGKVSFRHFILHHGATDQDVDLEGAVSKGDHFERVQDFSLRLGWRASAPDVVFGEAGRTRLEIPVAEALESRPVDVVAQAIEKEFERKRG